MKKQPQIIGLFQALGVFAYILFFAFAFQNLAGSGFEPSPPMGIIFVLLAFSASALICVSIVFLYPVQLLLGEHKKQAIYVVIWTAVWLAILFAIFALFVLL